MKKLTIEEMREIAKEHGGECLSEIYVNCNFKLQWKCSKGHEWIASPSNIKYVGQWCPICAIKKISARINPNVINEMQEIARKRGGECLSEIYIGGKKKLLWRCKNGHEWLAIPDNIKKGRWCSACSHRKQLTIEEMREIAKEHGGECLSDNYINNCTKLLWKCKNGHEWLAAPNGIKLGNWCPICSKHALLTIEEMREIAKERDGECLSNKYINNNTLLLWKCNKGHEWLAKPIKIKVGHWCPICHQSKGEKIINDYLKLNNIFFEREKKFKDCKGKRCVLPFDFYLPEYNILIEYDGKQHFEPVRFHSTLFEKVEKSFNDLKRNDKIKDDYCKTKGIILIRIPYTEKNIELFLKNLLHL